MDTQTALNNVNHPTNYRIALTVIALAIIFVLAQWAYVRGVQLQDARAEIDRLHEVQRLLITHNQVTIGNLIDDNESLSYSLGLADNKPFTLEPPETAKDGE